LQSVKDHTNLQIMKTPSEALADEIEAVAARLKLATSTVSERAGQGGKFYDRLRAGCRVWPETISSVQEKLRELEAARSPEESSSDAA
jgi:hypothetical protein